MNFKVNNGNKALINPNCQVSQNKEKIEIIIDKTKAIKSEITIIVILLFFFILPLIFLIHSIIFQYFFKYPTYSIMILFLLTFTSLPVIHQLKKYLKYKHIYIISIDLKHISIKKKTYSSFELVNLIEVSQIKSILYVIEEIDLVNNPDYIAIRLINNKKIKIYKENYYGGLRDLSISISKFLNLENEFKKHFKKAVILRNFVFLSIIFLISLTTFHTSEYNILVLYFVLLMTIFWIIINLSSLYEYFRYKKQ